MATPPTAFSKMLFSPIRIHIPATTNGMVTMTNVGYRLMSQRLAPKSLNACRPRGVTCKQTEPGSLISPARLPGGVDRLLVQLDQCGQEDAVANYALRGG